MTRPLALEDVDWPDDALNRVWAWAESGLEFTVEDVRRSLREPERPPMWGALFRQASDAGIIRYVRHTRSTKPSRKHGTIAVWTKGNTP